MPPAFASAVSALRYARLTPWCIAAIIVASIISPQQTLAQGARGGAITGTVRAAHTGEPIAGAAMQVEGTAYGTVTNAAGAFRFSSVPAGAHSLSARALGFARSNGRRRSSTQWS
jgi:hypothetical protein